MVIPGRKFSAVSTYRYGFNGKENDNEVKGEGNQQDYGFRVYDPRLAKFLSVDPLSEQYPWYTPYQFAGNKPIQSIDLEGAEEFAKQQLSDVKQKHEIIRMKWEESPEARAQRQYLSQEIIVQTGPNQSSIAPRSYFIERQREYQQAVGENVRGGIFGAIGYMASGDQGSFVGAYVDQAASAYASSARLRPAGVQMAQFRKVNSSQPVAETSKQSVAVNSGNPQSAAINSTAKPPNTQPNQTTNTTISPANKPANTKVSTLQPGPYAKESIPARGPTRVFTIQERSAVNAIGNEHGCHTCGSKNPGTKSGNWVPDHQDPSALNPQGKPQVLYPHCLGCSQKQGGDVNQAKKNQRSGNGN